MTSLGGTGAADTLKGGPRRRRGRQPFKGVPLPLLIPALLGLAFLILPWWPCWSGPPGAPSRNS